MLARAIGLLQGSIKFEVKALPIDNACYNNKTGNERFFKSLCNELVQCTSSKRQIPACQEDL